MINHKVNLESLGQIAKQAKPHILRGLPTGAIGLVVAPPDTGKSRLAMSIAYSLTTGIDLVGLLPKESHPKKVCLWGAEDGIEELAVLISGQLPFMSSSSKELIGSNLTLLESDDFIVCPQKSSKSTADEIERAISSLITKLISDEVDLLLVDTLREVIGGADETDDDVAIRLALTRISKEAKCTVLVVHHVTKTNANKNNSEANSVSQSGLSTTGAKARIHYGLFKGKNNLLLTFPKANKLRPAQRTPIELKCSDWGEVGPIFYSSELALNALTVEGKSTRASIGYATPAANLQHPAKPDVLIATSNLEVKTIKTKKVTKAPISNAEVKAEAPPLKGVAKGLNTDSNSKVTETKSPAKAKMKTKTAIEGDVAAEAKSPAKVKMKTKTAIEGDVAAEAKSPAKAKVRKVKKEQLPVDVPSILEPIIVQKNPKRAPPLMESRLESLKEKAIKLKIDRSRDRN